jgi:uncharacterized protein
MTAPDVSEAPAAADEGSWPWIAHLSGVLGFFGPLVVWIVRRDGGPVSSREAKEALNFQLTVALATIALLVIGAVLAVVAIGFAIALVAWLRPRVGLAFAIVGAVSANRSGAYRYPFTIRMVR